MEKPVNSKYIKFAGELEIPIDLELADYKVVVDGSVVSQTLKDNHDGTLDRYYKFMVSTGEVSDMVGESVRTIDKRKDSVKLRNLIEFYRRASYPEEDEDQFYSDFSAFIRSRFDDLASQFRK